MQQRRTKAPEPSFLSILLKDEIFAHTFIHWSIENLIIQTIVVRHP